MVRIVNYKLKIENSARGFTLIELLVVMVVMGVLAAVTLVAINPVAQFQRARDAQRKSDLRQIQSALEMYRSDTGGYPLTAGFPACTSAFSNAGITYMAKVPCDPQGGSYVYTATITSAYTLRSCLENKLDPQRDAANSCGGSLVSYTVSNP